MTLSTFTGKQNLFIIIPGSPKGECALEDMGMPFQYEGKQSGSAETALDGWIARVEEMEHAQTERRQQAHAELREAVAGADPGVTWRTIRARCSTKPVWGMR